MRTRVWKFAVLFAGVPAILLQGGGAGASENDGSLEERLLEASRGFRCPDRSQTAGGGSSRIRGRRGCQPSSAWPPSPAAQGIRKAAWPASTSTRRSTPLSRVEPWMDEGQRDSARGFRKLGKVFHREYGDDLAVYRCETGEYGQVRIYFVGSKPEGLSGLLTINTET
jgi:hypothetical protein